MNLVCANCHRHQAPTMLPSLFHLQFSTISSTEVSRRSKFRHVRSSSVDPEDYILCSNCANYLYHHKQQKAEKIPQYCWPGFVWSTLTNTQVVAKYGNSIWCFIPSEWRYWWIDSLKSVLPNVYGAMGTWPELPFFAVSGRLL